MPDPYDLLTIAAVTDELRATIGSGRVQRIGLLDPRTLAAEIYANGRRSHLIASADPQTPRLRLAPEMPSLDSALVTPFGLLLRKHVRGGAIISIDQPPLERLVRISIASRLPPLTNRQPRAPGEEGRSDAADAPATDVEFGDTCADVPLRRVDLYVELMGRHANLILVDDQGRIMESAKRVTAQMSRVRQVMPRLPYLPPPAPARLDPRFATPADAAAVLSSATPNGGLAAAIVGGWRGISPLMAREAAFRAAGRSDASVRDVEPSDLASAVRDILAPLQSPAWSPRVYRGCHESGDRVTFSPVPMLHLAAACEEVSVASASAGLALAEQSASDNRLGGVRHAQRRQRLLDAVGRAREKAEHRLTALASETARAAEAERHRTSGELIYANLWRLEPGQVTLDVEGATVFLDPTLTASENAQAYFERYRKAQSADAQIPALIEETQADIAYFDQLATLIAQAPGFDELESLTAEWAALATPAADARPRRAKSPRRPRPLLDRHGNAVFVGRSGVQNEMVTFDIAGPDDAWLHARGVAGSHVVIRWRSPGVAEDEATVAAAAALAAWYSAARESGAVEVDVAQRRHVRKLKGGKPGMVTYRNERTIRVQPAPEARLRDILNEGGASSPG